MHRVEVVAGTLPEILRDVLTKARKPRATAGEKHGIDVPRPELGLREHLIADAKSAPHEVEGQSLHLFLRNRDDAAALGRGRVDTRNRNRRLLELAELALRHLAGEDQTIEGDGIVRKIPTVA